MKFEPTKAKTKQNKTKQHAFVSRLQEARDFGIWTIVAERVQARLELVAAQRCVFVLVKVREHFAKLGQLLCRHARVVLLRQLLFDELQLGLGCILQKKKPQSIKM